jgi:hypothetical protein
MVFVVGNGAGRRGDFNLSVYFYEKDVFSRGLINLGGKIYLCSGDGIPGRPDRVRQINL